MYRPGFPLVAVSSQVDVQMSSKAGSPGHASPLPTGPALCEDGRPYVTDPVSGRKICMCNLGADAPYSPHGLLSASRKQGALPGTTGVPPVGFDVTAFYSPLIRGMPVRPDRLPPYLTAGMPGQPLTFDPALAGHPYGLLYAGMDMNGGPIRKAATRETTGPLKAWLSEHKKNPYPTKAEKIMLAIITRMSLTQVSTWFANARRRLKKENKLYPSGDNRDDDDDDDDDFNDSQREGTTSQSTASEKRTLGDSDNEDINVDLSDCSDIEDGDVIPSSHDVRSTGSSKDSEAGLTSHQSHSQDQNMTLNPDHGLENDLGSSSSSGHSQHHRHHHSLQHLHHHHHQHNHRDKHNLNGLDSRRTPPNNGCTSKVSPSNSSNNVSETSPSKPKIWSISEIISGASSTSDISPKRPLQETGTLHLPLQTNSPLALTKQTLYPPTSGLFQQASPISLSSSSAANLASSPLSSSPFSSSSTSPISPPAFRALPPSLLGGASPLFLHRPELPASFVNRYGIPVPSPNGFHPEKLPSSSAAPSAGSSHPKYDDLASKDLTTKDTSQSYRSSSFSQAQDKNDPDSNGKSVSSRRNSSEERGSKTDSSSRNDKIIKPLPVSAATTPSSKGQNSRAPALTEKTSSSGSPPQGSKTPSPYKPKTQNATQQNGSFSATAEVALDLQTRKRQKDS